MADDGLQELINDNKEIHIVLEEIKINIALVNQESKARIRTFELLYQKVINHISESDSVRLNIHDNSKFRLECANRIMEIQENTNFRKGFFKHAWAIYIALISSIGVYLKDFLK